MYIQKKKNLNEIFMFNKHLESTFLYLNTVLMKFILIIKNIICVPILSLIFK